MLQLHRAIYACVECGCETTEHNPDHIKAQHCSNCAFWLMRIALSNERTFQANGHAYFIGYETDYPKGFGGRRWRITFVDGRAPVETTSLWHGGEVPERFRDRLSDTAELQQMRWR